MEVAESEEDLANDDDNIFFFETVVWGGLHQVEYTSSLGKLHDDPYARTIQMAPVVLCDVRGVAQLCQESYLALYVVDIIVCCVEVDDFESDDVSCRNMPALVNGTVCAFSDSLEALVELMHGGLVHRSEIGRAHV